MSAISSLLEQLPGTRLFFHDWPRLAEGGVPNSWNRSQRLLIFNSSSWYSGQYPFQVRRSQLVAFQAWTFEQSVMRHDHVTATITLVPVSASTYCHQLEVALLNTIWTPLFIGRPEGRRG